MNFAALEELEQFLTANPETQVLELLMPDLSGILRAKRIHRSEFERLFSGSFLTPRSAPLLGIRGDWYDEIPLAEMGGRSRSDHSPRGRHTCFSPLVRLSRSASPRGVYAR